VSDATISVLTERPLAVGTDTAPPEQLPNLGRSLMGRQSGQAAPIIIIINIKREAISQSILPLQSFAKTVYPPLAPEPPSL